MHKQWPASENLKLHKALTSGRIRSFQAMQWYDEKNLFFIVFFLITHLSERVEEGDERSGRLDKHEESILWNAKQMVPTSIMSKNEAQERWESQFWI